jgi:quinol monooxygenase YgiN
MEKCVLCVIFKTKPGKRDELKAAFEKYIKPHVIENSEILQNVYNYSMDDPDTVCMFEVLSDVSVFGKAYEEPWMKEYLSVIGNLLVDKPQVLRLNPIWMKKQI